MDGGVLGTRRRWMNEVGTAKDVLITAQGMLMYLQPNEPGDLIVRCARRFAGATMLFDAVPRWFSERTMKGMRGRTGYQPPPMPWGVDGADREGLASEAARHRGAPRATPSPRSRRVLRWARAVAALAPRRSASLSGAVVDLPRPLWL
jgi:O-methyltransferase involved in polyketide biosynthesis